MREGRTGRGGGRVYRNLKMNNYDRGSFVEEFEVRGRQSKVKIWPVEAASIEAFEARRSDQGAGAR